MTDLKTAIKKGLFMAEMKTRLASVKLEDFQAACIAKVLINEGFIEQPISAIRQILTICDDNLAAPDCDYHRALQLVRSIALLKIKELE